MKGSAQGLLEIPMRPVRPVRPSQGPRRGEPEEPEEPGAGSRRRLWAFPQPAMGVLESLSRDKPGSGIPFQGLLRDRMWETGNQVETIATAQVKEVGHMAWG